MYWVLHKYIKLNPAIQKVFIHSYFGIVAYANSTMKKHISNNNLICLYPPSGSWSLPQESEQKEQKKRPCFSFSFHPVCWLHQLNRGGGSSEEQHPRLGCGVHTNYNENLSSAQWAQVTMATYQLHRSHKLQQRSHEGFHPETEAVTQRRKYFSRTLCS